MELNPIAPAYPALINDGARALLGSSAPGEQRQGGNVIE
jgi:hypothetical protein